MTWRCAFLLCWSLNAGEVPVTHHAESVGFDRVTLIHGQQFT